MARRPVTPCAGAGDAGLRQRQLAEVADHRPGHGGCHTQLHGTVCGCIRCCVAAARSPSRCCRKPRPDLARFPLRALIGLDGQCRCPVLPGPVAPAGGRIPTLAPCAHWATQAGDAAGGGRDALERRDAPTSPAWSAPPDGHATRRRRTSPGWKVPGLAGQVEPRGKSLLVEGLVATIGHDGEVSVAEAELLRTICAVLHCRCHRCWSTEPAAARAAPRCGTGRAV